MGSSQRRPPGTQIARGPSKTAARSGKQQPVDQLAGFPNSWLAGALANEAGRQHGAEPWMVGFGEDPDKFIFAEDGDDHDTAQEGGRAHQREALPALRPKHAGKEYEDFTTGTPFIEGAGDGLDIDPNDVKQGALGDCYLIAGMAAVARADPEAIRELIKDNGDGTFDVTLFLRADQYSTPRPVTKTVDARLAVKSAGKPLYAGTGDQVGDDVEIWAALIEKTLAQHKGSYDLISGGNITGNGFAYGGATEMLTGERENYMRVDNLDNDSLLLMVAFALESNKPVVASSRNLKDDEDLTREANGHNVYWNHAYAPESVDLGSETLTLQNPWGSHHVEALHIDDFRRFFKALRIGGGVAMA